MKNAVQIRFQRPGDLRFVAKSDAKKRARLNVISHLLGQIPYKELPRDKI